MPYAVQHDTLPDIVRQLRVNKVERVALWYDGENDEGWISVRQIRTSDGRTLHPESLPPELCQAMENWAYNAMPGGWELNEGSHGSIVIDAVNGKAEIQ